MGIEELIFSHHQKTIICDDPLKGVIAYVGGLDLTRLVIEEGGEGGGGGWGEIGGEVGKCDREFK